MQHLSLQLIRPQAHLAQARPQVCGWRLQQRHCCCSHLLGRRLLGRPQRLAHVLQPAVRQQSGEDWEGVPSAI